MSTIPSRAADMAIGYALLHGWIDREEASRRVKQNNDAIQRFWAVAELYRSHKRAKR
jgi:hypothetical protein